MAKAAAELRAYVADFTFSAPKMDIYSNLDGKVYDCSDLPGTPRAAHDLSGSLDAAGEERHGLPV